MSASTTPTRTEEPVLVQAAADPYPWPEGSKGMLALWLMLTTNPNFLLVPAAAAAKAGQTQFTPGYGNSKIQNWDALYAALTGACGDPKKEFLPAALQTYLTTTLQTATAAWPSGDITDSHGNKMTYATVLGYACQVFDALWPTFLDWAHPSPDTIDETVQ